MSVFSIFLVPLSCLAVTMTADTVISKRRNAGISGMKILKSAKIFVPALMTEWLFLFCFLLVTEHMMFHDEAYIPLSAIIITSAFPFAALFAVYRCKRKQLKKFLKYSACIAVIIFSAEILLFNGKSFDLAMTDEIIPAYRFDISGDCFIEKNGIVINGDSELVIDNVPDGAKVLICNMSQKRTEGSRRFWVQLGMKDDNFKYEFITVQEKYTMAFDKKCELSFRPYGKVNSLRLVFKKISEPVTMDSVRAVSAVPFRFSFLRYGVLLMVCVFAAAVKCFDLYKIKFQRNSAVHRLLIYFTAVVCALSILPFLRADQKPLEYKAGEYNEYGSNPYAQVFDAFQKGLVYLDVGISPEMETLDNVYDLSERDRYKVSYKWDYAYYKEHYYCYFGVAPVLTFYYPFYFVTGKLPTVPTAVMFFSFFAVLFFCLAIFAAVRVMIPEPNLLLLLLSMPAGVSCVGVYYLMNYADMYTLPLASGMLWLSVCLWSGLSACRIKRKTFRYIMFFISGTALALCAASRPGMTLGAALLLPFFFGIITNNKQKLSFRIKQAASFTIPLSAGLAGVLWYNIARFDSIFEFGASYQLTVSDISANKIHFSGIPAAFYHFLFQLPRPINTFPFFEPQFFGFYNYESYKYFEDAIGILAYPFVLAGMLMIPLSIRKRRRNSLTGSVVLQRNAFIIAGLSVVMFTAWQDFCLGGIIQRYVIDVMPVTVILSAVIINKNSAKKYIYIISAVSLLVTFGMGWLFAVEYGNCSLSLRCPNLYDIMEDMIVFWR